MRESRNQHNNHLLGVVNLTRRMYCSSEWIGIFRDIASRDWKVRFAWSLFEFFRGKPIGTLMLVTFGYFSAIRCALKRPNENDLLTLAVYPNESAALNRLRGAMAPISSNDNKPSLGNYLRALISPRLLRCALWATVRSFPILSKASRRDHFVSLCQTASLLACYPLFFAQLKRYRPRAVAISSASIPQPLALVAAARTLAIPSLFASHASFASNDNAFVPPTDAILMDGAMSFDACKRASSRPFTPILWGVGGSRQRLSVPQKPLSDLSVGLFLTAPVVMEGIIECLRNIYENIHPARVILRPHPIAILTPNLEDLKTHYPDLTISHGQSLQGTIEQCDIVVSGNSNVHREVLRAGVPSLYVSSLDTVNYDHWGLVHNQITWEAGDLKDFSLDQLQRFYDTAWEERFSAYDASYLESLADTQNRVTSEIARFLTQFHDAFVPHDKEFTIRNSTLMEDCRTKKAPTLALRAARMEDSARLLAWRNEEIVRQNSSNSSEISEETHVRWYATSINSPLHRMYILENASTPVGQILFVLNNGVATLSYSIDKSYRGQGLGSFLVAEGVQRALADFGPHIKIQALVKPSNAVSLAALRKSGFLLKGEDPSGSLVMEKTSERSLLAGSEDIPSNLCEPELV